MTVRVVLEFADEQEAKEFIKAALKPGYLHYSKVYSLEEGVSIGMKEVSAKVIGVFKKPTLYCNPADGHRNRKKTYQGWTRGKKYGWWVCSLCGKPTEKWANGDLWPYILGFNLLPKSISKWARPDWDTATQWTEEECGLSPLDSSVQESVSTGLTPGSSTPSASGKN